MQISALKKLSLQISRKISRRLEKSSAKISESEGVSNMEGFVDSEVAEPIGNTPCIESEEDILIERDVESEVESDIEELRSVFPELAELGSITELKNPTRYAALRDMGLSVSEAYLATTPRVAQPDNRAHLTSSVPRGAKSPEGPMTKHQLKQARAIFGDMSDSEIYNLYKKVTN